MRLHPHFPSPNSFLHVVTMIYLHSWSNW